MENDLKQKWKTNQSTKINIIGCDTIVNSPSLDYYPDIQGDASMPFHQCAIGTQPVRLSCSQVSPTSKESPVKTLCQNQKSQLWQSSLWSLPEREFFLLLTANTITQINGGCKLYSGNEFLNVRLFFSLSVSESSDSDNSCFPFLYMNFHQTSTI